MEKEAILNIVINDIKELDVLMTTFKGKATIPQAYFRLLHSKLNNLADEVSMLEELHNTSAPQNGKSVENIIVTPKIKVAHPTQSEETKESRTEEPEEILNFIDEEPAEIVPQIQQSTKEREIQSHSNTPSSEMPRASMPQTTVIPKQTVVGKEIDAPIPAAEPDPDIEIRPLKAVTTQDVPKITKSKTDHSVLGETIRMEHKSLNETISNTISADDLTKIGTPVNDIRKAMGINDRFYFQRELFDNDNTAFNNTLDQINSMSSYNEAYQHLKNKFAWDESLNETEEFLRAVRRRFL